METKVNITLQNLHCITPTDPSGEDEPYLWVFFVKADGTSIRQRVNDLFHLSSTIVLSSGSGRPGNLGVSGIKSGGNIHIPSGIGEFNSSLKPIVLNIPSGTSMLKLFIPGQVTTICIAIDEEAVPRDAMESAFNDVKAHVQNRINDFLNGLNLLSFATEVSSAPDPVARAQELFAQQFTTLLQQIQEEAVDVAAQSAEISVLADSDWWNPIDIVTSAAAGLDPDEPIGSDTFTLSEDEIIRQSLHQNMQGELRQPHTGLGGAWYTVNGYSYASIRLFPGDHNLLLLPETTQPLGDPTPFTLTRERKCITAGEKISFQRIAHMQSQQVIVNYPFLRYRYMLNGQELAGNSGTVKLATTVNFPEFDENVFYLIGGRKELKTVTINYTKSKVAGTPQLEALQLTNDASDGNYSVMLTIDSVLADGTIIPVGTEAIRFSGQSIKFADNFLDRYIACVAKSLGEKWVKTKRAIPEKWQTPEVKWKQYNEVINNLDTLKNLNFFEAATIELAKQRIATRLQLSLENQQPG